MENSQINNFVNATQISDLPTIVPLNNLQNRISVSNLINMFENISQSYTTKTEVIEVHVNVKESIKLFEIKIEEERKKSESLKLKVKPKRKLKKLENILQQFNNERMCELKMNIYAVRCEMVSLLEGLSSDTCICVSKLKLEKDFKVKDEIDLSTMKYLIKMPYE